LKAGDEAINDQAGEEGLTKLGLGFLVNQEQINLFIFIFKRNLNA
jgi:hypothetical protein